MIDLHMHSVFSDGSDTPGRLVELAEKKSLNTIALTDHDTLSGVKPLIDAAAGAKVRALGGLELSLEYNGRALHLLGYLVNADHAPLLEALAQILEGRDGRNLKIIAKLQQLGIAITLDDVREFAGAEVVARPHFAQALLKKSAVRSLQEAFDEYLASGAKAYVDRFRLELDAGVRLIREAGGVPVLAHPALIKVADEAELRRLVKSLVDCGLLGIECYYPLHSPQHVAAFRAYAKEFGLLETGGSDYHGRNKPEIQLGYGKGDLRVPNELADRLIAAARSDLSRCSNLN